MKRKTQIFGAMTDLWKNATVLDLNLGDMTATQPTQSHQLSL